MFWRLSFWYRTLAEELNIGLGSLSWRYLPQLFFCHFGLPINVDLDYIVSAILPCILFWFLLYIFSYIVSTVIFGVILTDCCSLHSYKFGVLVGICKLRVFYITILDNYILVLSPWTLVQLQSCILYYMI